MEVEGYFGKGAPFIMQFLNSEKQVEKANIWNFDLQTQWFKSDTWWYWFKMGKNHEYFWKIWNYNKTLAEQ